MTVNRNAKQYEPVNVQTALINQLLTREAAIDARLQPIEILLPNHGGQHWIGGTDPIPIGVASSSQIGLMPALNNNVNTFLAGDGTWQTPAGGGGGSQAETLAKISFGGF